MDDFTREVASHLFPSPPRHRHPGKKKSLLYSGFPRTSASCVALDSPIELLSKPSASTLVFVRSASANCVAPPGLARVQHL
jgi:hypothetical protein